MSRKFVQARLVDYRWGEPRLLPEPVSPLLEGPGGTVHEVDPSAVSELGVRVESRYVLARGTDGRPHLWRSRRTTIRPSESGARLSFDTLTPDDQAARRHPEASDVEVSVNVGEPTLVSEGVYRYPLRVSLTNQGARSLKDVVIHATDPEVPDLDPPLHAAQRVALDPGTPIALELPVLLAHHDTAATSRTLRVWATHSSQPNAPLGMASAPVESPGPLVSPALEIEVGPIPEQAGAIQRVPVVLSGDSSLLSRVQLQVQSESSNTFVPLHYFWQTSEASSSLAGEVSINVAQLGTDVRLRASVRQDDGSPLAAASDAAPIHLFQTQSTSPKLDLKWEVRDALERDGHVEALAIVTLTNRGQEAATDARFVFSQRSSGSSRFKAVDHYQREPITRVEPGESVAVPVILRLAPATDCLFIVRATVLCDAWAIGLSLVRTHVRLGADGN